MENKTLQITVLAAMVVVLSILLVFFAIQGQDTVTGAFVFSGK